MTIAHSILLLIILTLLLVIIIGFISWQGFNKDQVKARLLFHPYAIKYNGEWVKTSTQEYIDKANAVSRAFIRLGVQKNDKIALISSTNRTEWNIFDIGSLQVGAQTVPIYPTIASEDYEYILNDWTSAYTERALMSISKIYLGNKQYNEAIVHLKKLEIASEYKANYNFALNNLMLAYAGLQVPDQTLKCRRANRAMLNRAITPHPDRKYALGYGLVSQASARAAQPARD